MKEARHKRYKDHIEAHEQQYTPVIFSKNDEGLFTISVDLRKKSDASWICLFIIFLLDILYFLVGYFNPKENLFTELSL